MGGGLFKATEIIIMTHSKYVISDGDSKGRTEKRKLMERLQEELTGLGNQLSEGGDEKRACHPQGYIYMSPGVL